MADRATIAAVNNALKVVALPRIQKQFNNTSFLLNKLKRMVPKLSLGGRTIELSLKVGGSASWRTMDEMEALPGAKTPRYKLSTIPTKTAAAQFSISKQAMLASKGQEKAWIDLQSEIMSDTSDQFAQRMSQMFYRDGTGAVAKVNGAVTASATVVLDDDQTGGAAGADRTYGTKYLVEDMDISFSANKTGKVAEINAQGRINVIADATFTLTLDAAQTIADNSYVFIGSRLATSKNRDFMGLFGIVDDGTNLATLQGIDRTAAGNSFWKANLYGTQAAPLGAVDLENQIRVANDDIQRRNMGKPSNILTSFGVYRRFTNQIVPGRRFVAAAESQQYTTGIKELAWTAGPGREIPVEVDKDCPKGCLFLLDMSTLALGTMGEPTWLDDDGDVLKWDPGLLGYVGVYYAFGELICYAPNRNALLYGITED